MPLFEFAVKVVRNPRILKFGIGFAGSSTKRVTTALEKSFVPLNSTKAKLLAHQHLYAPQGSFIVKASELKPSLSTQMLYPIARMSRANHTHQGYPSLDFTKYFDWAALYLITGSITGYLLSYSDKEATLAKDDEAFPQAEKVTAATYKALGLIGLKPQYMSEKDQKQLERLLTAIEDVIHTGNLTFRVEKIINDTEFLRPLTRHDEPEQFPMLRHNTDYFRQYMADCIKLIKVESTEYQQLVISRILKKCADNGQYGFLKILKDEFGFDKLIQKYPLSAQIFEHKEKFFIQEIMTGQRVYHITPSAIQVNIAALRDLMIRQAVTGIKDERLKHDITERVHEKFKYVVAIDADNTDVQLDQYYKLLKAESERLGKPVIGHYILGAAHFTANSILVNAKEKTVSILCMDSFGSAPGTPRDITTYASVVRVFEEVETPYQIECMQSKFAPQRGESMGCSVHACMNLAILLNIDEWLADLYPHLKKLNPEERIFAYCREQVTEDDRSEDRVSYRSEKAVKSGNYDTWLTRRRDILFVRPPYPHAALSQSTYGTEPPNPPVLIFYTQDSTSWAYETAPITVNSVVPEQQGIRVQIEQLKKENSPYLVETTAPFPHPMYREHTLMGILDMFALPDTKHQVVNSNFGIDVYAQHERQHLIHFLLHATDTELEALKHNLNSPYAMFSVFAMTKRLKYQLPLSTVGASDVSMIDKTISDQQPSGTLNTDNVIVFGHEHELRSRYNILYGPELDGEAIKYSFNACLERDNLPSLLALLERYPHVLTQTVFEEAILKHKNLGKLAYKINQLDSERLPPQIANLLDTDMSNSIVTLISSCDCELARKVYEQLKKMPQGDRQYVIVSHHDYEYWDSKADIYAIESCGNGRVKIIPMNNDARDSIANPNLPTLIDLTKKTPLKQATVTSGLSFAFFAKKTNKGNSADETLETFTTFNPFDSH